MREVNQELWFEVVFNKKNILFCSNMNVKMRLKKFHVRTPVAGVCVYGCENGRKDKGMIESFGTKKVEETETV